MTKVLRSHSQILIEPPNGVRMKGNMDGWGRGKRTLFFVNFIPKGSYKIESWARREGKSAENGAK